MKEILLVGAAHGFTVMHPWYGNRRYEVNPPDELASIVEANSRVAIEMLPGDMNIPVDAADMSDEQFEREIHLKGDFFFRAIGRTLRSKGNEVIEIDDPALGAKKLALARRVDALTSLRRRNDEWLPYKKERKLGRSLALIDMIDSVLREDQILEAASISDADVVIIGRAHADQLAVSDSLQEQLGLIVKEYVQVNPDDTMFRSGLVNQREHAPSYLYSPGRDEVVEAARIHNIRRVLDTRRYNAFTIGRVLDSSLPPPDYLGRFYLSGLTAHSMFELEIEERYGKEFTGSVRDVLGDAEVDGIIDEDGIDFTKRYITDRSDSSTSQAPIYYKTTDITDDGVYKGRYDMTPDTRSGYIFSMTAFSDDAEKCLDDR